MTNRQPRSINRRWISDVQSKSPSQPLFQAPGAMPMLPSVCKTDQIKPETGGIGVFIFSPTQSLTLYVVAQIQHVSSVLMAEAGALVMAARISNLLSLHEAAFFSDNETMVNILGESSRGAEPLNFKLFTTYISGFKTK